jgi:hypothetical protein
MENTLPTALCLLTSDFFLPLHHPVRVEATGRPHTRTNPAEPLNQKHRRPGEKTRSAFRANSIVERTTSCLYAALTPPAKDSLYNKGAAGLVLLALLLGRPGCPWRPSSQWFGRRAEGGGFRFDEAKMAPLDSLPKPTV